jgi:hypothetical protein
VMAFLAVAARDNAADSADAESLRCLDRLHSILSGRLFFVEPVLAVCGHVHPVRVSGRDGPSADECL